MCCAQACGAQTSTAGVTAPPPEQYTISPGGVDMRTGKYAYRATDLAIGDAGSPTSLSLERLEEAGIPGHVSPFGNMADNLDITLTERRRNLVQNYTVTSGSSDFQVYVNIGGRIETFRALNLTYNFEQLSRTPTASIAHTGTRGAGGEVYTYTGSDGTVMTFRPLGLIGASDCSDSVRCAYVSEITSPDGTKLSFSYDTRTSGNRARLASVSSDRGYILIFEHNDANWNLVTKACAVNLAQVALASTSACPTAAAATSSYTYTTHASLPKLASATDPSGRTSTFSYAAAPGSPAGYYKASYYRPGETQPWLANLLGPYHNAFMVDEDITYQQTFADGTSWTYAFDYTPLEFNLPLDVPTKLIAGGTYTDAANRTTSVRFSFPERPFSLGTHPVAPSIGQILFYYVTDDSTVYEVTEADPSTHDGATWDVYNVTGSSRGQDFASVVETLELGSLVQCNECGGSSTSPYQFVTSYQVTPGPTEVTDPLNRTVKYDYCDATAVFPSWDPYTCAVGQLQSVTTPEGVKTSFKYYRGLVSEKRMIAKPGSALPDAVRSATYATTCPSIATCDKPLTVTDANSNVTTYTYDSTHGGVLTEVGPAVAGVSPARKFAYVQRYAWIKNSGGTYVQAAQPVWLLSEERRCKASALDLSAGTCAAGASDLIVTSYDYGPDSGPNNLWLRGTIMTADGISLRTCYGYDGAGNRTSVTAPRAGLTVCP